MTKAQIRAVWLIWFILVPIYVYSFIRYGIPVVQEQLSAFISYLILILIASRFPIRFRETSIVPLHSVSLAVFLHLGLVVEMFIMQLGVMTSLFSLNIPKQESYRYPLNSIIFMIVSVTAASLFYLFGGTTGLLTGTQLSALAFPIFVYAFTYFFLNHLLIYLYRKYILRVKDTRLLDEAFAWEGLSFVLIIPVGITLLLLYQQIGFLAIILVGIPLISISLFLKLYNNSETTARLLKKISAFGYRVNDIQSENKIYRLFIKTVMNIFPADGGFLYDAENGQLKIAKVFHSEKESSLLLKHGDGISKEVFSEGKSRLYHMKKEWLQLDPNRLFGDAESIVSVPFIRNHEVVGVLTLFSKKKKAFDRSHLMLLEIMINSFVVAIYNTRNYEKTRMESERCALTKLYNYRYFENLILEKYDPPSEEDEYAIILIDLDHFKRINDTFGHHSGNEVLCQVAEVLEKTVGDSGIVARYGGEEFVVLVEGENTKYAETIAEALRKEIESHLFIVSEDISGNRERKSVRITASIGFAKKMEADESPMSVLRNADRAMYVGAKQKGRNRVAQFQ